jgi:hypothetical protein
MRNIYNLAILKCRLGDKDMKDIKYDKKITLFFCIR